MLVPNTLVLIYHNTDQAFKDLPDKKEKRKKRNMSYGKKNHTYSNYHSDVRTLSLSIPKIHSELSCRSLSVTVIGIGSLSF